MLGSTTLSYAQVDESGKWEAKVELKPGGPYNLTVIHRWLSLPDKIELTVLAGEVWLCVGSDNMALPMAGIINNKNEIKDSLNYTQVSLI